MNVIRLILLVAVLGGLTLFLAQNWSLAIPLVFLGWRTQPLSLAMWMLLGAAAGALTSLLISSLLQLSSRYVTQQRQTTSYSPSDSPRVNKRTSRDNEFQERKATPTPPSTPQSPDEFENTYDDWDLDRNLNDDWDFEQREYFEQGEYSGRLPRSQYTKIQDDRDYEDFREPENDYKSADSSYSYNKRDLKNSGVGKTESIYDADYRVIIPPPNPSTTSNTSDDSDNNDSHDEDWGFLDEDFDSDDKPSPRQ